MAPSSSKRSSRVAARSQLRAHGARRTAKIVPKAPAKGPTKNAAKLYRRAEIRRPRSQKRGGGKTSAQSYTAWATFSAAGQAAFGYGTYFTDSEPRS
jgi:hypothetical protein